MLENERRFLFNICQAFSKVANRSFDPDQVRHEMTHSLTRFLTGLVQTNPSSSPLRGAQPKRERDEAFTWSISGFTGITHGTTYLQGNSTQTLSEASLSPVWHAPISPRPNRKRHLRGNPLTAKLHLRYSNREPASAFVPNQLFRFRRSFVQPKKEEEAKHMIKEIPVTKGLLVHVASWLPFQTNRRRFLLTSETDRPAACVG